MFLARAHTGRDLYDTDAQVKGFTVVRCSYLKGFIRRICWAGNMVFLVHHIFPELDYLYPPPSLPLFNLLSEPYIYCEKIISGSDPVR